MLMPRHCQAGLETKLGAIAGAVHVDGRDMTEALLASILRAAVPRGFDGVKHWHDGPAGLIRFAHATTPEAVGEVQPFISDRSGAVMVFDGRFDNRAELIAQLGVQGEGMKAAPDGEIALALFDRRGDDYVTSLVGDFAIAVWQPQDRRLLLVRSPYGWRPLVWTFDGTTFGFATEPRSLVVGLGMERKLNEAAIGEFLSARFVSQTDTFWQGLNRLPQGSALALEKGRVRQWHWHVGPFEDQSRLSEADHVARFQELFDQALIATTRSATPLSSQLSGGLDSSSVVCRATELHRAGRIDRQIGAITARFPGEPHDETEWSSAVEAHLGITAKVVGSHPFSADAAAQWCADTLQLPLRPNVLDTMAEVCARQKADGERVLLTGEGGDDWLAGSLAHWPDLARRGQWRALVRTGLEQFPDKPAYVRARRILYHGFGPLFRTRHRERLLRPHLDFATQAPPWLNADWAERIGLTERWHADALPVDLPGIAQKQRYGVFALARRHVNVEPAMAYSASFGIEQRHPFHDQRLASFMMGASGSVLNRYGQKKYLLRQAMKGTLPEKVRTRKTKAAFVAHTVDAISDLLRRRPPEQLLCAQLGWVDGAKIGEMHAAFQHWRDQGSTGPIPDQPWGPVWFTLAMDMWLENAFKI